MAKPKEQFDAEHEAFRKRLRAINASPIGIAARDAMNALRAAYRDAALAHWKELGNRASTGWHSTPEGDYQTPQPVEQCADSVADRLAHHFSQNPRRSTGQSKGNVVMADKTTTEQINAALRELDRAMPDVFATIDVHLHGDINRPDNILKTINSACVYVEGGFGRSVASSGHHQLRSMLSYKAGRTGDTIYVEPDSKNSTKRCSNCKALTGPTGLSGLAVRQWVCSGCGSLHDRDQNSAINALIDGAGMALERKVA